MNPTPAQNQPDPRAPYDPQATDAEKIARELADRAKWAFIGINEAKAEKLVVLFLPTIARLVEERDEAQMDAKKSAIDWLNDKACCDGAVCNCRGITRLQQMLYEEAGPQFHADLTAARAEVEELKRAGWKELAMTRYNTMQLLYSDVANLRAQLATAQAERDGLREDKERLDFLDTENVTFGKTLGTPENPPLGRVLKVGLPSRVRYYEGRNIRECIDAVEGRAIKLPEHMANAPLANVCEHKVPVGYYCAECDSARRATTDTKPESP